LSKWNKLHKTPNKRRDFTFVLRKDVRRIIKLFDSFPSNKDQDGNFIDSPSYPFYAYIRHDKDRPKNLDDLKLNPEAGVHYHFFIEFSNPRSFCSVADELELPVTSLEPVRDKVGILRYLTHENSPDKHHYSPDEVVSNFNVTKEIKERSDVDFGTLLKDYGLLRSGFLSATDFLLKYKIYIVRHCSFYQQIKLLGEIYDKAPKE
ncbi:MAG: hypothetical protein J6S67_26245, partial [Methanobrevibacter sp.]|nr:hypothetical protein [Methanobrevibacter sp.]